MTEASVIPAKAGIQDRKFKKPPSFRRFFKYRLRTIFVIVSLCILCFSTRIVKLINLSIGWVNDLLCIYHQEPKS